MKAGCIVFICLACFQAMAQEISSESLLEDMATGPDSQVSLLPDRMLFTQRALWGEKGLYRLVGLAPKTLTIETRERELKARRTVFKIHQGLGLLAAGGMIAQAIIGPKLYNGSYQLRDLHKKVACGTNIAYGSAALLAFTAPPPMVNRKRFDNIKLHKILSIVHLSGMIATNVLAHQASAGKVDKKWHRAAATTTFGAYTAAILSIKFEF